MSDFRSMQDMFNGTVDGPVNRQPTPLFLADALNADARSPEIKLQAASELRRLYGLCIQLEEELNAKSQRTWVGLTDEEVMVAAYQAGFDIHEDYENEDDPEAMHWWTPDGEACDDSLLKLRDLIEAKLKEKNNGN